MTASDSAAHNLHHSRCARYFGRIWSLNDARPEIHNTTQSHCQRFADSSLTSELSNSGTKHQFNCGTCLCCLIAGRCRASRPLDSLWLAAYSSLFRAFAFALPQIPALGLAPPPTHVSRIFSSPCNSDLHACQQAKQVQRHDTQYLEAACQPLANLKPQQ
jgi:hypothetical protein